MHENAASCAEPMCMNTPGPILLTNQSRAHSTNLRNCLPYIFGRSKQLQQPKGKKQTDAHHKVVMQEHFEIGVDAQSHNLGVVR